MLERNNSNDVSCRENVWIRPSLRLNSQPVMRMNLEVRATAIPFTGMTMTMGGTMTTGAGESM